MPTPDTNLAAFDEGEIEAWHSYVKGLFQARGRPDEDALDVANDALKKLSRYLAKNSQPRSVQDNWGLLTLYLQQVIADRARYAKARKRLKPTASFTPVEGLEEAAQETPAQRELKAELERLLAQLPASDRELLYLHFVQGMTYATIAKQRGGNAHVLRASANRVVERLRKAMSSPRRPGARVDRPRSHGDRRE